MAISVDMGSVIWMASGQGIAEILNMSIGNALILFGCFVAILGCFLNKKIDVKRNVYNIIFMILFSYLVEFMVYILTFFRICTFPFLAKFILMILSLVLISIAVALYQKADIVLHPNDELMLIVRNQFTKNNATKAQALVYIIPIGASLLAHAISGKWIGIGVGTVMSILFQGPIIDLCDCLLFSKRRRRKTIYTD
ncbi:hypothetical protein [Enterococcus sp. DIV0187]|uniref:hypothetical protein n=1 Tax=Enterococcus sp. DIV0187 TaxID=2774644 RepID=UPI003F1EDF9E